MSQVISLIKVWEGFTVVHVWLICNRSQERTSMFMIYLVYYLTSLLAAFRTKGSKITTVFFSFILYVCVYSYVKTRKSLSKIFMKFSIATLQRKFTQYGFGWKGTTARKVLCVDPHMFLHAEKTGWGALVPCLHVRMYSTVRGSLYCSVFRDRFKIGHCFILPTLYISLVERITRKT